MAMIVDGVFQEAFLISGVGSKQQRITIRKK
jgi:type IV secretion system protein VirB9